MAASARSTAHRLLADWERKRPHADELLHEKLAASKAYRQLQRDEITFQQMWLRVHRHLLRLPLQPSEERPAGIAIDELMATLRPVPANVPYRKPPTPGPNQPCSCGSNIKYKKCCGNPLRQAA